MKSKDLEWKTPSGTLCVAWKDNHLPEAGTMFPVSLRGYHWFGWKGHECCAASGQRSRACKCWYHFKSPNQLPIKHGWYLAATILKGYFPELLTQIKVRGVQDQLTAPHRAKCSPTHHQAQREKNHWLAVTSTKQRTKPACRGDNVIASF